MRSRVYSFQYPVSLLYLKQSIKLLGILMIVVLITFMDIREGILSDMSMSETVTQYLREQLKTKHMTREDELTS